MTYHVGVGECGREGSKYKILPEGSMWIAPKVDEHKPHANNQTRKQINRSSGFIDNWGGFKMQYPHPPAL